MLPDGWAASTIDYTLKLLAPAVGEKLVARGRVVRSGRTLTVAAADVFAVRDGNETLDRDRDGFVMGEGAGILVIEELQRALAREARPIAEVVGYCTTADAYHLTSGAEDG